MSEEKLVVRTGEKEFVIILDPADATGKVVIDGEEYRCMMKRLPSGLWSLLMNEKSYLLNLSVNGTRCNVGWGGGEISLEVEDERDRLLKNLMSGKTGDRLRRRVRAPMPGLVVKILTETGAEVKKGQPLVVVEAMKMENEITAPSDGKVAEIKITDKQAVEKDEILITLEG